MASSKFNARHGLSVGSTPIDVIDSAGNIAAERITGLATVATSGDYTNLINKPVTYTHSTVAPSSPVSGDRWLHGTTGIEYTWVVDQNSSQWVQTTQNVLTSIDYQSLTNKPTLATVATSGSYTDLTNKPTITTIASQTGNSGKILSTDGTNTTWITAPSGGGGSVDLTAVAQNILPATASAFNIGSDVKPWKSIRANHSIEANSSAVYNTGIVTDVTNQTANVTKTYRSISDLGYWYDPANDNWPGALINAFAPSGNNSGTVYLSFFDFFPAYSSLSALEGVPLTFTDGNYTFTITPTSTLGLGSFGWEFTYTNLPDSNAVIDSVWLVNQDWDNYNTSFSGPVPTAATVITVDGVAEATPSDALFAKNGIYKNSLVCKNPLFEPSAIPYTGNIIPETTVAYVQIYYYGYLAISTGDYNTPFPSNSNFTKITQGSNLRLTYIDTNNGDTVVRTAILKITSATPTDYGAGVWQVDFNFTIVSDTGDWIQNSGGTPYGSINNPDYLLEFDAYVPDLQLAVQSANTYIKTGTYTDAPIGTVLGYVPSPKIKLGSDLEGGSVDISYNIKTKKISYGGLSPAVDVFTNSATQDTTPALVSFNSQTRLNNTGSNRDNSIILGRLSDAGTNSISIGNEANTGSYGGSDSSVCIGPQSYANSYSVAIGQNAYSAFNGVAVGPGARSGYRGVGIGGNHQSAYNYGLAVGFDISSYSEYQILIGNNIQSDPNYPNTAKYSIVIGHNTVAYVPFVTQRNVSGSGGNQNPTLNFQYYAYTSFQGTRYLTPDGGMYSSTTVNPTLNLSYKLWDLFTPNKGGLGLGKAVFIIRRDHGSVQTIDNQQWRIVEIRFSLYKHNASAGKSTSDVLGNYQIGIISTTTLATNTGPYPFADTTTIYPELTVENVNGSPRLCAKIVNLTAGVSVFATAKFEIDVLNNFTY